MEKGRERGEGRSIVEHLSSCHSHTLQTHPGVLPLVRHGDDVSVEEMAPVLSVAAPLAGLWRLGLIRISLHPCLHYVVVELF